MSMLRFLSRSDPANPCPVYKHMKILFLNLPPYLPKKPDNGLYFLQASMNLGMLSVASAAKRQGHSVIACDWLGPQQRALDEELPEILSSFQPDVVGFSIPSGYAEPYLRPFASLIKAVAPTARIVVGGQYHAGFRVSEILRAVPEVDAVVMGAGEPIDWNSFGAQSADLTSTGVVQRGAKVSLAPKPQVGTIEPLRWELYGEDIRAYAPSIEIGRGCPFTCSFCSLSGAPERLTGSTVESISEQLSFWIRLWDGLPRVPLYAECPVFFCTPRNLEGYRTAFGPFAERLEWRVQARVDSIEPVVFPDLYELGLRVIDLGLESASPRMLRLMKKTPNPERYLDKAAAFIRQAAESGIGVKLNILLYPGEDRDSAAETETFIMEHGDRLAGIAAGSALEFPGTALGVELPDLFERFGTRRVHDPLLASCGIYPLDLSADFSFKDAREWCLRVSKRVMTSKKYYDLKRIGYYSPSVTYDAFMEFASRSPRESLPFSDAPESAVSDRNGSIGEQVVQWDQLR